jgi:ribose transport system permease protein
MDSRLPDAEIPSSATVAEARPSQLERFRGLQGGIGLVFVLLMAVVLSPRATNGSIVFFQTGNLSDILRQVSEIGIIALGMTFVILTAGIDLSVGSVLAFSACITAMLLVKWQPGWPAGAQMGFALAVGVLASTVVGALNGALISRLRIQAFIATLATMIGVRGLVKILTENANTDFGFGQDVGSVFAATFANKSLVIATFAVLAAVFAILLSRTVFGRYVRAIGDNETAAAYAGLPIVRTKIAVYALCGMLTGIAGVLHAAQNHQGNPNDGISYELEAIAAVVIGGTSLAGGKGTIVGTLIGTLIVGILTNILQLRLVDANVILMVKAVIIVLAVWAQSRRRPT